jgi:uncharacterized surface protein with fasciclin (FAS1) repeats
MEDFSTLCDLATQFGFVDQFDDGEPATANATNITLWTVFAPTNDAFERISDALANLDEATVIDVLRFHAVVDSVVMSSDLVCGQLVTMVNGKNSR